MQSKQTTSAHAGLLGACVGDALGVPHEFKQREEFQSAPVTGMVGYGTYDQPPGTWSDDSSLLFCLAESLCQGYNLSDLAERFVRWHSDGYWTPHGEVFDIGITTKRAISRLRQGVKPTEAGYSDERSNGNGSLMRILPLAFYAQRLPQSERFRFAHEISCLTHAHPRSQMACGFYTEFTVQILERRSLLEAYEEAARVTVEVYSRSEFSSELTHFDHILSGQIAELAVEEVKSDGYVIHTLEAALWCLLRSSSYANAVLGAVNLGGDTDTTATVAGGVAGMAYGYDAIPQKWIEQLARRDEILDLADRFSTAVQR